MLINFKCFHQPLQNESEFAAEFVKLVESAESDYHNALSKTFITTQTVIVRI